MRKTFDPQLRELARDKWGEDLAGMDEDFFTKDVGGRKYYFIVGEPLSNVVDISVLLLTPSGRLRPGDLDNRFKTLIDSLSCPPLRRHTKAACRYLAIVKA